MPAAPTAVPRPVPLPVTPGSRYGAAWQRRLGTAPTLSPTEILGVATGDGVLVAVAHPDDETLAMGAALARLSADGVRVQVVVASRRRVRPRPRRRHVAGLADRRAAELSAAALALGVSAPAPWACPTATWPPTREPSSPR